MYSSGLYAEQVGCKDSVYVDRQRSDGTGTYALTVIYRTPVSYYQYSNSSSSLCTPTGPQTKCEEFKAVYNLNAVNPCTGLPVDGLKSLKAWVEQRAGTKYVGTADLPETPPDDLIAAAEKAKVSDTKRGWGVALGNWKYKGNCVSDAPFVDEEQSRRFTYGAAYCRVPFTTPTPAPSPSPSPSPVTAQYLCKAYHFTSEHKSVNYTAYWRMPPEGMPWIDQYVNLIYGYNQKISAETPLCNNYKKPEQEDRYFWSLDPESTDKERQSAPRGPNIDQSLSDFLNAARQVGEHYN